MTAEELLARLRTATDDDVAEALRDFSVSLSNASNVELLELFNIAGRNDW